MNIFSLHIYGIPLEVFNLTYCLFAELAHEM